MSNLNLKSLLNEILKCGNTAAREIHIFIILSVFRTFYFLHLKPRQILAGFLTKEQWRDQV